MVLIAIRTINSPRGQLLLERLNHAVTLLEARVDSHAQTDSSNNPARPSLDNGPRPAATTPQGPQDGGGASRHDSASKGFGQLDIPETAAASIACESILKWTVFNDMPSLQNIKSFLFQADADSGLVQLNASESIQNRNAEPCNNTLKFRGINEEDAPRLCQKFLDTVYQRNPVVDGGELKNYARHIAEHGFGWDGRTCLVVRSLKLLSTLA